MSFYAGVIPADGFSAQASINWSKRQTSPQSPTSARATSASATQSVIYTTPVTPAQAYARSVVSGQPVLHYTIERQQPDKSFVQQPAPLLESPVGASPSARGQSYAQRLYASALAKQPQAQTTLQTTARPPSSSEPVESPISASARSPASSYGARASIMLNAGHDNRPQAVSAFDFYHSSVSRLGFQSRVPDRGTSSAGVRRPQSAGSASIISAPHSPLPLISQTAQAPHDLQEPGRRGSVDLSDMSPPSPAGDPQRSIQAESPSRSPPSTMTGSLTLPDPAQIPPQSVSSYSDAMISPSVPPVTPPRELSPYPEGHSGESIQVAAISSNPESATQLSHPPLAPIRTGSLDVGSEEVPLYSLVDDEPPPPDFAESQSDCSLTTTSMYHDEALVVLAPPDLPSPTSFEFDAVPSTSADIVETPRTLSPEPLPESPQPPLVVEEVSPYSLGKAPVCVIEKLYGYSAEDLVPRLPEKSPSHSSMVPSLSSRTLSVPSNRQPRYNDSPQDIQDPPVFPAVSTRNDTSAKVFSTASLSALPPRRPVVATLASTPVSAPPPMLPAAPSPLSPKVSAVIPDEVRPATSLPLRPGGGRQPARPPPLPLRARAESTFPPSSVFIPPSTSASTETISQMYHTASPSSPLPSPAFPQHSRALSVPFTSSTGSRPEEFGPQLSPAAPPTFHGYAQVPYQPPRQGFQPQASPPPPPPPPQHSRAQTSSARSPQSSRGFGANIMTGIAGGALGLLGGAVLAEALGGDDVVNDLTGSMAGMSFGDPTGGLLDSSMGSGDQILGSGFDPTANFQGDQMFVGDSFSQTYDMTDQFMGGGIDPGQVQGQSSMLPDQYFASEQVQETQQFNTTQTFDVSQSQQQQQPTDQSGGTHYLHDAGQLMQAAYKIYNATHQSGAAQGSQSPQAAAPQQQTPVSAVSGTSHPSGPLNLPLGHAPTSSTGTYLGTQSSSASVPFHGTSFAHPTTAGYPSSTQQTQQTGQATHLMISQTAQPPAATPFSQHYSSVNPASQQGTHPLSHHHLSPQSSHTQTPYINHVAYPSSGTATHTMHPQGPPMPAQYAVNHGAYSPHGTATHHSSPGSQAHGWHSAHPTRYPAQGNPQQSPTAQQPPGASAAPNKAMLARQFVKGALMAGSVLAKYNKLSGGNGFAGNGGAFS
ncbi:hypothetical protein DFH29DRAFT_1005140 [Suillus ampliporus]|nr:hypothetical protein DFH29DRAFT_1005140 [Suillus ampliporus]